MEQYGIPFDRVRADTRADLLINAAQRRAVQNEVMVTDQEAQALIEREGLNQGQVKLSQILIGLAQAPTSEQLQQAQSLANEALTQLNQGTRFEDVARAYSQAPMPFLAAIWAGARSADCSKPPLANSLPMTSPIFRTCARACTSSR